MVFGNAPLSSQTIHAEKAESAKATRRGLKRKSPPHQSRQEIDQHSQQGSTDAVCFKEEWTHTGTPQSYENNRKVRRRCSPRLNAGKTEIVHGLEDLVQEQKFKQIVSKHVVTRTPNSRNKTGILFLITNFTDALSGYQYDRDALKRTFTLMDYDVILWENLTATNLRNQLNNFANETNANSKASLYARAVVVVMTTHGRLSYRVDNSCDDDDITPAQIVHILCKVDTLRNNQKLVLLANLRNSAMLNWPLPYWNFPTLERSRNTIIYQCHNLAHKSIVNPKRGSWLMQTISNTFRRYHQQMDVRELLCEVHNRIEESFQRKNGLTTRDIDYAMPTWTSTLCSRFFLTS